MFKLNQKGMTLVETMVAAGLLGGLAVAGMTLFKTQNKAQKTVEQNYEVTATLGAIRSILADSANCSSTLNLGGLNPTVTQTVFATAPRGPGIEKDSGGRVYPPGAQIPGNQLRIISYTLTKNPDPGPNITRLNILFSRGSNVQTDQITKTILINYVGTTSISSCYAVTSGNSDSLWQISSTINDIFYNSGNVGIGTADPSAPLEVYGSAKIRNGSDTNWAGAFLTGWRSRGTNTAPTAVNATDFLLALDAWGYHGTGFNRAGQIILGADAAGAGGIVPGRIAFNTTSSTGVTGTRMLINSDGNVGIGTTAPGFSLHVLTSGVATGAVLQSTTTQSALALRSSGSTTHPQIVGNNDDLYLQTLGSERLRVLANGNVGIGTSAPTERLEVRGNAHFRGSAPAQAATIGEAGGSSGLGWAAGFLGFNSVRNAATSNWTLSADGANNGGSVVYGTVNGVLRFVTTASTGNSVQTLTDAQVAANTRMVINAAGDVGIGTTSPQAALDVRASGSNAQIKFGRATNSVGEGYIGANNNHALLIHGQDLATQQNLVTVTQTGNVGIGGSSTARLGIYDSVPVQLLMRHTGASNNDPVTFTVDESTPNAVQFWISPGDDFDAGGTTDKFHIGDYATGVARFTVLANGWTGINQPNPTQMLDVNGGFVRAQGYMYSSDKRLKKDIKELKNPLKRILALKGHSFSWKDSNEKDMGFIAQEVQEVEPTLVAGQDADFLSVKYGNITALLVEAFKELKLMIDGLFQNDKKLEAELAQVKAKNAELEARLDKQDKLIQQILSEKKK